MSDYYVINSEGAPIKTWTRGVPIEDQAKLQLLNVASLPFIYKHVAVMPDVHWGMGATVGSVIATKGAIVPAAIGVDIGCFRGDTHIPLLDGTQASIASLVDKTTWVYSCTEDGQVVPGLATGRITRRNTMLVRVVVSGGDEIICTPDHQFMLLDGTYCEARSLRFNQSLMPLYRRWQARDGYESCAAGNGRWRLTHELVYEHSGRALPNGHVIHHGNVNHFDNRPDNLEALTASAHSTLHRRIGRGFPNRDPVFQQKHRNAAEARARDPIERAKMMLIGTENITRYMVDRPDHFAASVIGNGERGAPFLSAYNVSDLGRAKSREMANAEHPCPDCGQRVKSWIGLHNHRLAEHATNHKVLSVETLNETADVYCLQVETYHNFALAAGVFVHNCGMVAARLSLRASDLPDTLAPMRSAIESAVPHGRTDNGGANDRGAWSEPQEGIAILSLRSILEKHPKLERAAARAPYHLGTLGTGNHFIEVCLDEEDRVWVMLHSGSRGIGNAIGSYFIERAKEHMRRWFVDLPDADLAYLPENTQDFDDYMDAVGWAQDFALANRRLMLDATIQAVSKALGREGLVPTTEEAVNCHHNYVARENHFGQNVLVTRKGAVRAREGDLGIIPGSMGAKSFIVRGKGNPESFMSCSHGAGRRMSRGAAKKAFTIADHEAATAGVECRKDEGVIDETPGTYKDIDAVMAAQVELIDIVHTLKQIVCVKG